MIFRRSTLELGHLGLTTHALFLNLFTRQTTPLLKTPNVFPFHVLLLLNDPVYVRE